MLKLFTKKQTKLEKEIDSVLDVMDLINPDAAEYKTMSENLERLYKAKSHEHERRVSPDTLLLVAGNLLGLVLVLNYEKTDIIRSKAFGWILKGRV